MTISLEQLQVKLAPRFPGVEQVGESVLRFERKAKERTFAVCYIDVSANIPSTTELLSAYQERIVAARYFQGRKSLQWSNYLFFVVDTLPVAAVRTVVERDRRYARKFIVTEPELEIALTPPAYKVSKESIRTDILGTWRDILAASNLDRAILNDESLPKKLELIEQDFGRNEESFPTSHLVPSTAKQPFLRQITLEDFRRYPLTRTFDIGTVTLFCGANGSGKTSILEAIELVYCGQNKRNPKEKAGYLIFAKYGDETTEFADDRRKPALFRDRSLAWYGQYDSKIAHLYQPFGRFNFLDTDAAVGLADAKSDLELEEDLSKLLVGPDAAKTWHKIESTANKLDEKIKDLESARYNAELTLASANRQISVYTGQKQESDAVLNKLDKQLAELLWGRDPGDPAASASALVESLSLYGTIVKQLLECDWIGSQLNLTATQEFISSGQLLVTLADPLLEELTQASQLQTKTLNQLLQLEKPAEVLGELSGYFEANLPQRFQQLEQIETSIKLLDEPIAGFKQDPMEQHMTAFGELTVTEFQKKTSDVLRQKSKELSESQQKFSSFSELRAESESLAQRLRDLALQILKDSDRIDECPLCHRQYPEGELSSRMEEGIDPKLEATARTLLDLIRECETDVEKAQACQQTASWAAESCRKFGEPVATTKVSVLLNLVVAQQKKCELAIEERDQLRLEVNELQAQGLTRQRYLQLLKQASIVDGKLDKDSILESKSKLQESVVSLTKDRDDYAAKYLELLENLSSRLGCAADIDSIKTALMKTKQRLATTMEHSKNLQPYLSQMPWPQYRPLSELAIAITTIRELAGDFQQTLAKERAAIQALEEVTKQKERSETQLAALSPRIEIFSQARNVLSKIQNQHSLSGAMANALSQNRAAIEGIFARIHSPAEFDGLGETLKTLRRRDGSTASLQQISTGQRAAFALSLFLAQNAQLQTAPPVILIDDPIAHVDDMNCLSFLDYLRELVIQGDRQVLFATANEKLAALFERKFDFLGEQEFKRYDLSR